MVLACLAGAGGIRCAADTGDADAVLDRWIASIGGRAAFRGVSSYEIRESVDLGRGSPVAGIHVVRTKAGHFREETTYPGFGTLVQAWDGMIGWQSNDRLGAGLIPQADLGSLVTQDNLLLPLYVDSTYKKRRVIGHAPVNGSGCTVLGMTGANHLEERWYFDDASSRFVRVDQPKDSQPGKWATMYFSDFRTAGAVSVPYTIKIAGQGSTVVIKRQSLAINPPTDEAAFMISTARLVEVTRIEAILSRNLAEVGGDAIGRIHSRIKHMTIVSQDSGIRASETTYQEEPNLFLNELDTPGEGIKWEGFDGTVRWTCSELEGFHLLGEEASAQWKMYGNLADEGRLLERFPLRRMLGPRQVDGRATHAVILSDFRAQQGTWYFDDENARLLRLETVFLDNHGKQEATQDYSDFRRIDGVEMPFAITETNPAGQTVETIDSVQDNVSLDAETFKLRRGDW
jgi:hypothetical protein